ncbi:MAG TPA: hypothetical protein VMT17_10595 [Anaeromyxobacteraceae bacterium]|nr:hypothetical protein [Anaeromyxobacteraceae bacterium]
MRHTKVVGVLGLLALTLFIVHCGFGTHAQNPTAMKVGVSIKGLSASEGFCFTYTVYSAPNNGSGQPGGSWAPVSGQQNVTVCAPAEGVDRYVTDAICQGNQLFVVTYQINVFECANATGSWTPANTTGPCAGGSANTTQTPIFASSSGSAGFGQCVSSADPASIAEVQFAQNAGVSTIDPGVQIDQVCLSNKDICDAFVDTSAATGQTYACTTAAGNPNGAGQPGEFISSLFVEPTGCACPTGAECAPDNFCQLFRGAIQTKSYDGCDCIASPSTCGACGPQNVGGIPVRSIQNLISPSAEIWYLLYPLALPSGSLLLIQRPWVVHNTGTGTDPLFPYNPSIPQVTINSWYYLAGTATKPSVGFLYSPSSSHTTEIFSNVASDCDAPLDISHNKTNISAAYVNPQCNGDAAGSSTAVALGTIPGGSGYGTDPNGAFMAVFSCASPSLLFVPCNAANDALTNPVCSQSGGQLQHL